MLDKSYSVLKSHDHSESDFSSGLANLSNALMGSFRLLRQTSSSVTWCSTTVISLRAALHPGSFDSGSTVSFDSIFTNNSADPLSTSTFQNSFGSLHSAKASKSRLLQCHKKKRSGGSFSSFSNRIVVATQLCRCCSVVSESTP